MKRFLRKIIAILDGTPTVYGEKQRGQSLVELTLTIPILAIMFVGLVEVGWFAQNYLNLLEASKVGARRGPFLNDNNSPAAFFDRFTLEGEDAWQPPDDIFTPGQTDIRYTSRGIGDNGCNDIPADQFGFYNLISCTVRDALAPMEFRKNGLDDIVISAFSLEHVDIGTDLDHDGGFYAGLNNADEFEDGPQVIVVGRWPSLANECFGSGILTEVKDERDPFDWLEDGDLNVHHDHTNLLVEMHYLDDLGDPQPYFDSGREDQRGWMLYGQREIETSDGQRSECFGSSWTMTEMQDAMNLKDFIDAPAAPDDAEKFLPSQGVVLVELFWDHDLMFEDFPLLSSRYSPFHYMLGNNDPESTASVLYVWAAFPVPSAKPNLLFQPVG